MSSQKSFQLDSSDHTEILRNKSIQGKIFDQSTLYCLKGDDDQQIFIPNITLTGSKFDELKQRSHDNSTLAFVSEKPHEIEQEEFTFVQTQSDRLKQNNNEVLLISQILNAGRHIGHQRSNFINNTQEVEEIPTCMGEPVLLNTGMNLTFNTTQNNVTQVSQFLLKKQDQQNNHQLNQKSSDLIKLEQRQSQQVIAGVGSQSGGKSQQSLEKNPLTNNDLNQQSQSPSGLSQITIINHQNMMVRGSIPNFERAANIINKVLSKSMNRVQRINKHVQTFVQFLKNRMNNRRMPDMQECEYKLLNDVSYYRSSRRNDNIIQRVFRQLYTFAKLKIPIPVFMPTDTLRVYSDIFQVFFTYVFIYIYSILIFFANEEKDTDFIQQLFKSAFIVFLFDMLVNLNTAYFDKDLVITNRKKIVWKYLSSPIFLTDCINLVIMGWKVILQSTDLVYNPNNNFSTTIINLLTFLKLNGVREKRNRFSYVFTLKENQKHIIRLFNQLLSVITVAHIAGIAWYQVGVYELENGYAISWLTKYDFVNLSYLQKYIYSLYWSITTMTTVGYGDISASNYVEALFITVVMILFSCVFAYSINNIGFILQEIEKASKVLNDNITTMQRYLNRKNVNLSLQSRVRHYLSFLAEESKDRDQQAESAILNVLSNKLRDEITIEINSRIIKNFGIFSANFSSQTLRKLVFIMEEVLISPNEIIFEEGDSDDQSIYIIENGIIEIYQLLPNGNISLSDHKIHLLQSLGKEQMFGDISFFSGLARKASARSVNLSTLYKISRNDFIDLVKENPEDFERFKMMEEQIRFQQDISTIFIECYNCKTSGHTATHCPRIHQVFDVQFKILKENFSIFQDRNTYTLRKCKTNRTNPRLMISKNQQVCMVLKENIRNFNSMTEIMFMTEELDAYSQKSEDEESQSKQEFMSSSDSSSTSSMQVKETKEFSTLKSTSSNKDKIKSLKKVKSKKQMMSSKQLKSTGKKEESTKNINSFKDIENLENIIVGQHLQSSGINQIQEAEGLVNKSNSLMEKQSDFSKRESFVGGAEDIREVLQINNIEFNEAIAKSPLIKSSMTSHLTSTSQKEPSSPSIPDNEDKKNRTSKKRNFTLQVNYASKKTESEEDINSSQRSNEEIIIKSKHNLSKAQQHSNTMVASGNNINKLKTQKSEKKLRPSIDILLSNAIQTACIAQNVVQICQQNELGRIERSLSKLEERMQSFVSQVSNKSFKNIDQISVLNLSPTKKKSTLKSFSSSVFNKLSGYNQENRHSQLSSGISQQTLQYPKEFQNIENGESSRKNSSNCVGAPTQQHIEVQFNEQQIAEKITKMLGLQDLNMFKSSGEKSMGVNGTQTNLEYSMDFFDMIRNYKKFFPHNNFTQIFHQFKFKKLIATKKQRLKTLVQIPKPRRNNIVIQNTNQRKSLFCNAIIQKYFPSEINYDSYKPTYLSYGTSQKSQTIYPKNLISIEILNYNEQQ